MIPLTVIHRLMYFILILRRPSILWLTMNFCSNCFFGITGNLWKWLQAYLTNRVQRVSVNNAVSDVVPVVSGVPQGSILDPILFLVFVNDILAAMTSSLVLFFADDAKCVKSISQMSDCLSFQEDLNKLVTWSTTWNLLFNEKKCSMVRFCSNDSPVSYNYHLNSKPVEVKTC